MLFRKNHLNEVLETTSASMDVFVPAIVDGTSRFALYGEQGEVTDRTSSCKTRRFPQRGFSSPPPKNSTPGAKVLTAPLSTAP